MQAVILAAGRGSRMGAKANGLPKCLLQVGGRPLIDHQLDALAEVGAAPVAVVVGYGADLVGEAVERKAETILNARYEKTNSLYSFWLARSWVKGPVIVMNCDVLFDREMLDALVRAGPDHLLYDSSSGRATEHMKVALQDGIVTSLSKSLPKSDSCGENVGMLYFSEATAHALFDKAQALIDAGRENAFLAEAVSAVAKERPIRGVDIAGLPWTEIDSPFDLERARHEVWPSIFERTGTRLIVNRRKRRFKLGLAATLLVSLLLATWFVASWLSVKTWEQIPLQTGTRVSLVVNHLPQEWWFVAPDDAVRTRMSGPRKLRIDVRSLLPCGQTEQTPYVVQVSVNGQGIDWYKFRATPDPSIEYAGATVGDRDKINVAIPNGEHTVEVRLVAGAVSGLFLRMRVLEENP